MLSELWPVLVGEITKPNAQSLFFLPQHTYISRGSLRDLLLYPNNSQTFGRPLMDADLHQVLVTVRLQHLTEGVEGLSREASWSDILSPGEQQRLSIARMLLRQPTYAVLDECTSAIDLNLEEELYRLFRERGITVISVGHRSSLRAFHDLLLEFDGQGGWQLTSLTQT